ncbi:lariat debranching enzyme [Coemansia sp. RSA 1200]|nr:lariat debranching enzyme [Coemansia sp. RSA 1200]
MPPKRTLRIAIEGCCHGMLDDIYSQLAIRQQQTGQKIDLLIICGDFQAIRNITDLKCMSCPDKYKQIGGFYRYYTGERQAPVLTMFVGGNHEAGNHMRELYYGGWVAPKIFYMGGSSVVRFGGLRIGGISGIFKDFDFAKGYYEQPPFRGSSRPSMHHVRSFEVFKMLQTRTPLDIVISHDWPQRIERFGDTAKLLSKKPFFKDEIDKNELGSPANALLMERLRPKWWFSAHMHVRFTANVGSLETMYDKGWNGVPPYDAIEKTEPIYADKILNTSASASDKVTSGTGVGTNKDEIAIDSSSDSELSDSQSARQTADNSSFPNRSTANKTRLPLNLPPPKQSSIAVTDELALESEHKEEKHDPAAQQQSGPEEDIPSFAKNPSADEPAKETSNVLAEDPTFSDPRVSGRSTKFLALDKCLPRRQFMEVVDVEVDGDYDSNVPHLQLEYDPEWLAILRLCQQYMPLDEAPFFPPENAVFTGDASPIPLFPDAHFKQELEWVNRNVFAEGPVFIPPNFVPMAPTPPPRTPDSAHFGLASRDYGPSNRGDRGRGGRAGGSRERGGHGRGESRNDSRPWDGPLPYFLYPNPQTDDFCRMLGLQNILPKRRT